MRRLSIGCSGAPLLCAGVFAHGQEKPNPSQDSQPFLKQCSDKNPPPCADKPPTVTSAQIGMVFGFRPIAFAFDRIPQHTF